MRENCSDWSDDSSMYDPTVSLYLSDAWLRLIGNGFLPRRGETSIGGRPGERLDGKTSGLPEISKNIDFFMVMYSLSSKCYPNS